MTVRELLPEESLEPGMNHFKRLVETGKSSGEMQFKHKDGTKGWWNVDAVKLTERRFMGFVKDVTLLKKIEDELIDYKENLELVVQQKTAELTTANKELVFQNEEKEKRSAELAIALNESFHDQLTGLYNRRYYEEELKRLDTKRNFPLTIVMGDVNGLKLINDSLGHAIGDELLKKTAEIIKKGCRTDDITARIGGDEFVIILPKTDALKAEQIINRINELALKEKVGNSDISIAFGYKTKCDTKEKIQDIFYQAEDQMYINKRSTIEK